MKSIERWFIEFYRFLAAIPVVFLGIGFQRAWSGSLIGDSSLFSNSVYFYVYGMVVLVLVNLLMALNAEKITPLYKNRPIIYTCAISGVGSSALIVVNYFVLQIDFLGLVGAILFFISIGISMLMWCEFFGSLSTIKVLTYYSAALACGGVLGVFLNSLTIEFASVVLVIMPLFNVIWAVDAPHRLAEEDAPKKMETNGTTFPLKLIVIMALVTFAERFVIADTGGTFWGPFIGSVILPSVVVLLVFSGSRYFELSLLYRIALPIVILAMLICMPFGVENNAILNGFVKSGSVALAILVMVVFSSLTYRYGVNAVRLNGIERSIRYSAYLLGWLLSVNVIPYLSSTAAFVVRTSVIGVVVIVFSVLFISESEINSRWGVSLTLDPVETPTARRAKLIMKAEDVCKEYKLTPRESEVFLLLVQNRSLSEIESELYIATGTLKAHMNHIYSKLGIHRRSELNDFLTQ